MVNHPNRSKRPGTHPPTLCEKDPISGNYSEAVLNNRGGGWTFVWKCPACERSGRFLANLLSKRTLYCDGVRFIKSDKPGFSPLAAEIARLKAAGEWPPKAGS